MKHTTARLSVRARRGILALLVTALCIPAAFADGAPAKAFAGGEGLFQRQELLGDLWGARSWLTSHGVDFEAVEQAVPSYVASGGVSQGPAFAGLFEPSLDLDLEKLLGASGLTVYLSAWILQGQGPTASMVRSFSGISFVEAPAGARLADAYLRWDSPGHAIRVKLGKFGIDEDFDQNPAASSLLDSNYTYRDIMANNLPGGGPAFSYEGPGAMIAVRPAAWLRLRAGLFSGDPVGLPVTSPPQNMDSDGLIFPLDSGALVIGEADLSYGLPALGPGTLLVGTLYDTLPMPDLLYSASGQSLADPAAGPPRMDANEYVVYAGLTQTLWRGAEERRLKIFARGAYAPPGQNIVTLDVQGGLALDGPFSARPRDTVALAASYDRISSQQAALVADLNALGGPAQPTPTAESDFELAYCARLTPWLSLTPDLQYLSRPGGGIADPLDPAVAVPNAVVVQAMMTVAL